MHSDRATDGKTNNLGNMVTLPVFKTFLIMGKQGKAYEKYIFGNRNRETPQEIHGWLLLGYNLHTSYRYRDSHLKMLQRPRLIGAGSHLFAWTSVIDTGHQLAHEYDQPVCSFLTCLVLLYMYLTHISEKAMAPHSSTFAWKIPWIEKPGRLQSMGSLEWDTTERLHFHFSLSCTGEGNGNPLQCSCLENPRDGAAWWAAVYGVAQSRARLKRLSSSSSMLSKTVPFTKKKKKKIKKKSMPFQ